MRKERQVYQGNFILIIAVIALAIAVLAFQRTGGIKVLRNVIGGRGVIQ